MNEARMLWIDMWNNIASDFSDGAYMAFMEGRGVSMEELEAYWEWCEKKGATK